MFPSWTRPPASLALLTLGDIDRTNPCFHDVLWLPSVSCRTVPRRTDRTTFDFLRYLFALAEVLPQVGVYIAGLTVDLAVR